MNCPRCQDLIDPRRVAIGRRLCLLCGEEAAREERAGWTILTPHKQGAMFFTPEFARVAARGINNKGGLHR